ncbi:MAG: PSD1 and planctomycete cytochrome C domain-containing protein [Planctomycetota bacterium]
MKSVLIKPAFACLVLAFSVCCCAQDIDFSRDIRPILSGKCFKCHGPDENSREADLRLDLLPEAISAQAIVPGSPEESSLLERITTDDPDIRMPPNGDPLTDQQIEAFRNWILAGAEYERHWAYEKPKVVAPPPIEHDDWPRSNPIDNFVQAQLHDVGLEPTRPADPAVLLRRLSLDLIGLPPSVEDVVAFERDPSGEKYEAVVDRLLQSKHFGEKWALHWLDLARYADSNGYQHDDLRTMWPYRDWVINAFNEDLPFDEFTIDQLAGDLIPDASRDQIIATGFHRNVPTNFSGGSKVNEVRANVLHDRVSTTGQVWLGMTMECCQCHDHKFDPISQVDYYELYAFFNQAIPELSMEGPGMFRKQFIGADLPVVASPDDASRVKAITKQIALEDAALENAKPYALAEQVAWEKRFLASGRGESIPWERFAWNKRDGYRIIQQVSQDRRTEEEQLQVHALLFYDHRFTGPYEKAIDRLQDARDELVARTMVMKDSRDPVVTHVFQRGNYLTPGDRVEAGVPDVLHPIDSNLPANRLGLARWIVDAENPLTARVTVNRLWAEIFGQGIVTTPEDFGMQSAPPTHPELLDWLAREFMRQDWSMKRIIKTIVMSSTYRQSAAVSSEAIAIDPSNRWLARGPRFRLTGEAIRDNLLAISGLLSDEIGGPSVYPPQPEGLWKEISGADVKIYPTSEGKDRYRRGLYSFLRRGNPNPMLLNFDGSNRSSCVVKRDRSNTPVQALSLLNGPTFVDAAHAFADWITTAEGDTRQKITTAFRRAVARTPTPEEITVLLQLYQKHGDWFDVAQVILNLDETVTKS